MSHVIELFPCHIKNRRVMMFVDGENLAIRYGSMLGAAKPPDHVRYEPSIYVWSNKLVPFRHKTCDMVRTYYYTSMRGDIENIEMILDRMKEYGIENPYVFKKTKTRGSKRVDITLATDMLSHAHKKNYDLAVLVAGDEDYIPLVRAVKSEGCQVFLWFIKDGLSKALCREVDHFTDLTLLLCSESNDIIIQST
jgi:uncharacterized LabA/DUF88 family protein